MKTVIIEHDGDGHDDDVDEYDDEDDDEHDDAFLC